MLVAPHAPRRTTRLLLLPRLLVLAAAAATAAPLSPGLRAQQRSDGGSAAPFTVAQVRSYPFPNELAAAATGSRIAWALNERGLRNVWVAEGPAFAARQLTRYDQDDGQELTSVQLSADGRWVVYVRGGDHGGNWDDAVAVNPTEAPVPPKVQIWTVPFAGGEPKPLGDGDEPTVSPKGDVVAFVKDKQIWVAPIDGGAPAKRLVGYRGEPEQLEWSPDGSRLAFVSNRGDHAFVAVWSGDSASVVLLAPSTSRDGSPRWSPDGRRIAFVRRPGAGGAPDSVLARHPEPWAIWTADARTGEARLLWTSPATLRGSVPTTHGGTNLHWAAGGRIVFLSNLDGWPHLYSIAESGGAPPMLLTPGSYMVEHVTMSPDRRWLLFSANTGPARDDVDRRHLVRVPVSAAKPEVMTPGTGLEWTPVPTGDGQSVAFIGATAQRPPLPMAMPFGGGDARAIGADRIPADFPTAQLVVPRAVTFKAADGVVVHGQLFDERLSAVGSRLSARAESKSREPRADSRERAGPRPAIIFVHGGPPRQMLLGWHYSDYYANTYAMNQYLASRGYVVLSVNYRLGIGYGYDFHVPSEAGPRGASEYRDVVAAAEWLRAQPGVDGKRIGIWGGSYGGFLTALALARNSDLFAAGVDLHGVHDWTAERTRGLLEPRYEKAPDAARALDVAWASSPVASVKTWRSPVLLIHGDDDRNVRFAQTVDLARRLAEAGVAYEELVIPDDTHHWMRHANALRADSATAAFFDRKLGQRPESASAR